MTAKILLFDTHRYRNKIDAARGEFSRTWVKVDHERILLPIMESILGVDRDGFRKAIIYMVEDAAIAEPRVDTLVGYIVRMFHTYIVPEIKALQAPNDKISCSMQQDTIKIVLFGGQHEET